MMSNRSLHRRRRGVRRRGTTAVEFAITAPLALLFFLGAFEFCRVAMVRHTVDNAVYESCRVGIIPGSTRAEVVAEANRVLSTVGITGAAVAVAPRTFTRDTEEITVTINVPLDQQAYVPAKYFAGQTLTRELTMRREGLVTGVN